MKKSILFFLTIAWLGLNIVQAQDIITVSGTVTNELNGNPVANHDVNIMLNDSNLYYSTAVTNPNGFYTDTIFITGFTVTSIYIVTNDLCTYGVHDTLIQNPGVTVWADFEICVDSLPGGDCQADFYYVPDSLGQFAIQFFDNSTSAMPITSWTWNFGDGYVVNADLLYTKSKNSAIVIGSSMVQTGIAPDGRPVYTETRPFWRFGSSDYTLTNVKGSDARSFQASINLSKYYDNGFDWSVGYAYTDAEDVSPMTSSVAGSNFDNLAVTDVNNPGPATSNYEVPHRFTLRSSWGHNFWSDLETRISLFGYSKEGQPQSYVMGSGDLEGDGYYGRHLLYVPTSASDPNVVFDGGFDTDAFFAWVQKEGLKGGMQDRNGQHAKWSTRFDLLLSQELPFFKETKGRFYVKVYNLGNLIDDSWGHVNDAQFFSVQVVNSDVNDAGQYVYTNFNGGSVTNLQENRSLWDVRFGIEILF